MIYFKPDGKTTERALVSVKGGENVSVAMVRDFAHVVEREKAELGLFVTLTEPTGPMKTEAIKMGFIEAPGLHYERKIPRIQILTIEELLGGKKADIPHVDPGAFKQAPQEETGKQGSLPLAAEPAPPKYVKPKRR